jgi:hypothetical protein
MYKSIFMGTLFKKLKITAQKLTLIFILFLVFLNSCGIYKYTDQRNEPTTGIEKARKSVREGKGVSVKNILGNKNTNYEFSTSNPLWRATLDTLDFIPLSTVDYSGGLIISDWYNQSESTESLKIEIRFLSNEIQTNSLKVRVFKKNCDKLNNNCSTQILKSRIEEELTKKILRKAALLKQETKK